MGKGAAKVRTMSEVMNILVFDTFPKLDMQQIFNKRKQFEISKTNTSHFTTLCIKYVGNETRPYKREDGHQEELRLRICNTYSSCQSGEVSVWIRAFKFC